IYFLPVAALGGVAHLAGFEDLLDGAEQAFGIFDHDAVEIAALRFVHRAALQRLEIQTDGGDRCLQLVGDGVEESVLALVALDFANDKDSVHDQAGNNDAEEDDAKNEQPSAALMEDDPTDVEEDGQRDQASAKRDEEGDGLGATGDAHGGYSKSSR